MSLSVLGRTVDIRAYRPEDEPALLRLYETVFGISDADARRDREWRYMRNPAGSHQTIVAVLEDGEAIASCTGIPLRARLSGQACSVAVMEDAMTHPSYRGAMLGRTGLFVRTVQNWVDNFTSGAGPIDFSYGTPQPRHARLGQLLMGYELWDGIGYYSREIRDTPIKRMRRRLPEPRVVRVDEFGAEADAVWERLKESYPSAVIRDARYLQWRYKDAPVRDYIPLALRRAGGQWDGWLVLSVADETATIVDALLPVIPPAAASALVYRAIGVGLEQGARHIQAWATPGSGIEELLKRNGFGHAEFEGARFAARTFAPSLSAQRVRDEWYFQPGDTDEF